MKRRGFLFLLILASYLPAVLGCIIPNDNPPAWQGNASSTYQSRLFSDDDNPVPPEVVDNPFDDPLAMMYGYGCMTAGNITYLFISDIPEPATIALLCLGALSFVRRK